jgi:hypothetical protein
LTSLQARALLLHLSPFKESPSEPEHHSKTSDCWPTQY